MTLRVEKEAKMADYGQLSTYDFSSRNKSYNYFYYYWWGLNGYYKEILTSK